MFTTLARLAGLGAFGACAGFVALYAGFVYFTLPGKSGGMDMTSAVVLWIAVAGVTFALIVVHVMIGRRLLLLADGPKRRRPL